MKVLTIKQPWAWLIAQGFKDVENRTWQTSYRGPLAIHVGKSEDVMKDKAILNWIEGKGISLCPSFTQMRSQMGHIIAVVKLTDIVQDSSSIWAIDGQFHWEIENVQLINPIPAKGKLGLWRYS